MDKLNELSSLMDRQVQRRAEMQKIAGTLSVAESTWIFTSYRTRSSEELENLEVLHTLTEEMRKDRESPEGPKLFGDVKTIAPKVLISEEQLAAMKEIITEGIHVDQYALKLAETRKIIQIFRDYGSRNCDPSCLQNIKVYFRELFLSKDRYRGKQALTIVRDYLLQITEQGIKKFDNNAHYLFLREKVSREYFRETGRLDLYIQKVRAQQKLFETVSKIYLLYDLQFMRDIIYDVNLHILTKVEKLLEGA